MAFKHLYIGENLVYESKWGPTTCCPFGLDLQLTGSNAGQRAKMIYLIDPKRLRIDRRACCNECFEYFKNHTLGHPSLSKAFHSLRALEVTKSLTKDTPYGN